MFDKIWKAGASCAATVMFAASASAATLTLDPSGHTVEQLQSFNPSPAGLVPPALTNGADVVVFTSNAGGGLDLVLGAGESVDIKYTYLGKEAGFSNGAYEAVAQGGQSLTTSGSGAGAFATLTNFDCGFGGAGGTCSVPLDFTSVANGNPVGTATNGGAMGTGMSIAWWSTDLQFNDDVNGNPVLDTNFLTSTTWYALLDDSGANVDEDWDDMILAITISQENNIPVPVPAPFLLLLSGLLGLGFLGRLRGNKRLATSS